MGMSFSVAKPLKLPASLVNIFNNLKIYGHIKKIPEYGCLDKWNKQGVLLLNTALTTIMNKKLAHAKEWEFFTDAIIKKISDECDYIVFLLWGSFAYKKIELIDLEKHNCIITSHPSPLSYNKKMNIFPAFKDSDIFGNTNKYLIKHNKKPINWKL